MGAALLNQAHQPMKELDPCCTVLRPLGEYSKRFPSSRAGKNVHRSTIWRWAKKGLRGIVLRTHVLGGCRYACDADFASFMRELEGSSEPAPPDRKSKPSRDDARIRERFGVADPEPG
jgi:Protein of unknown function (DUF1580)